MTTAAATPHESNRAFYDRISHIYDALAQPERPHREAGVAALALKPGEKVLELGFGTGNEIIDLARLVGPTGAVTGIDVSAGMLAVAKQKVQNAAVAAELSLGDARALAFPDGAFDAVYTSFTLELFADAEIPAVLLEAKRVLRPGGRLAVVAMGVVKSGNRASALEKGYVWMHRHFPHIVDCHPIDAVALVAAAGFAVTHAEEREIWTMPVQVIVGAKG